MVTLQMSRAKYMLAVIIIQVLIYNRPAADSRGAAIPVPY